jgi:4-oxalmesaconate hydratase
LIIDCHGHYTTAPAAHQRFRDAQIAGIENPSTMTAKPTPISDDEIRETIETNQLKLQKQRGADLTLFSPRASAMGHHIGDEQLSIAWTRACNDLIHRVVELYPVRRSPVPSASSSAVCASWDSSAAISIPILRAAIGRRRR